MGSGKIRCIPRLFLLASLKCIIPMNDAFLRRWVESRLPIASLTPKCHAHRESPSQRSMAGCDRREKLGNGFPPLPALIIFRLFSLWSPSERIPIPSFWWGKKSEGTHSYVARMSVNALPCTFIGTNMRWLYEVRNSWMSFTGSDSQVFLFHCDYG